MAVLMAAGAVDWGERPRRDAGRFRAVVLDSHPESMDDTAAIRRWIAML